MIAYLGGHHGALCGHGSINSKDLLQLYDQLPVRLGHVLTEMLFQQLYALSGDPADKGILHTTTIRLSNGTLHTQARMHTASICRHTQLLEVKTTPGQLCSAYLVVKVPAIQAGCLLRLCGFNLHGHTLAGLHKPIVHEP